MKMVLTGGGTGGHIFPLVSIARKFKEIKGDIDIYYLGPKDNFAQNAFQFENISVITIPSGKIRRYFGVQPFFQNLIDIFIKIPFGIFRAYSFLKKLKPNFIFSKGGYGSIPIIIAGKILGIDIYLHESDSIAGTANKITGNFAKKIFVSFPLNKIKGLPAKKLIFTGNPIRKELTEGDSMRAKRRFSLSQGEKPVLLVLGGSQGSIRINSLILENLDYLLEKFEIIHQTGTVDYDRVVRSKNNNYHVYGFWDEQAMADALACSSLVIGRSGAGTISEIAANGKPSILIPLPESAQNHQLNNATIYEQSGACIVIEERHLNAEIFVKSIENIMNPSNIGQFCSSAKYFSKSDPAERIAKEILEK